MSSKSVAVVGNVEATVGKKPYTGAGSGKWTMGEVIYESYPELTINKENVIYKATCSFSFSGKTPPPPPLVDVIGDETVILEATVTLLQKGTTNVLRDGDTKESTFGNKLVVSTNSKLKST